MNPDASANPTQAAVMEGPGGAQAARTAYDVRAVTIGYRRHGERGAISPVLHGLSFHVPHGSIFGIIGPNGAGKTSLLKLLGRVLIPQAGDVLLLNKSLRQWPLVDLAETVGYVPQDNVFPFPYTIGQMVLMGRFPHQRRRQGLWGVGWESREDVRVARDAMEAADVTAVVGRPVGEVSSGERQRAVIARALAQQPSILLLDEPTASLDLRHQSEIGRLIGRLNRERGLTVVVVSHDLTWAGQVCDRLLLLDGGRIVAEGTPADVLTPDVLERAYHVPVLVDAHPQSGKPRVTLSSVEGHAPTLHR